MPTSPTGALFPQYVADAGRAFADGALSLSHGGLHTSRGGALIHGDEVTIAELLKAADIARDFWQVALGDTFPMRRRYQGFDESPLIIRRAAIAQPRMRTTALQSAAAADGEVVQARGYCTDVFSMPALDFIAASRSAVLCLHSDERSARAAGSR